MKKVLLGLAIVSAVSVQCRKIEVDDNGTVINPPNNSENVILEGRIIENRTLKKDYVYKLRGLVYVTNGAVLTIEPGTKIVGERGRNGGLIITRSAKIVAEGTVNEPIVFTSEEPNPQRGDWAGIAILGNAPTNSSFNGIQGIGEIEGGINNSDGLGLYGTPITQQQNPADNSGVLRYVRIEYAGYAFLPDKEINSLTLAGVGNQTEIDHVQVSYANDDAFEFFGGTVNASHLIAYRTLDDDFDTDSGYSGKIQFGIVLRDSAAADISKVEGFESDNDANGSENMPQTSAVFSNFTILGPKATLANTGSNLYLAGVQIRRNSSISIFNSVIAGWPKGLLIDGSKGRPTDLNISSATPSLFVQNTVIAGTPAGEEVVYAVSPNTPTGANSASILAWFNTPAFGNRIVATNNEIGLGDAFNYSNPDFNPTGSSILNNGAAFTHPKLSSGFTPVTYIGAAAAGDAWWKTWTKFSY